MDLNSTEEQIELSKEVFKKNGIIDIPVDGNDQNIYSIERNIELCIDYIEKNELDIDWIIWCSHDGYFQGSDFMERFEDKLKNNPKFKTEVGVIGFRDEGTIEIGKPCYGRGDLAPDIRKIGGGWYQNLPAEYEQSDYFLVQAAHDNIVAVNVDLWKKHIKPDYDFILFTCWDDISMQFALKNMASITIPSLVVVDCYREKSMYGLQRSLNSSTMTHIDSYKKKSWHGVWTKKYKYKRGRSGKGRPNELDSMYNGTILEKIHGWYIMDDCTDCEGGPKTLEDL